MGEFEVLQQLEFSRPGNRLSAAAYLQSLGYVVDMPLDRVQTDV